METIVNVRGFCVCGSLDEGVQGEQNRSHSRRSSLSQGLAWGTRMGTWFLPYNFFAELFAFAAPFMPDWKTHNKSR
jgi:hypothetical protein